MASSYNIIAKAYTHKLYKISFSFCNGLLYRTSRSDCDTLCAVMNSSFYFGSLVVEIPCAHSCKNFPPLLYSLLFSPFYPHTLHYFLQLQQTPPYLCTQLQVLNLFHRHSSKCPSVTAINFYLPVGSHNFSVVPLLSTFRPCFTSASFLERPLFLYSSSFLDFLPYFPL